MTNWVAAAYGVIFPILFLIGIYALVLSYQFYQTKKNQNDDDVFDASNTNNSNVYLPNNQPALSSSISVVVSNQSYKKDGGESSSVLSSSDTESIKTVNSDVELFITARNSQSKWRVAYSMFAGCVGSWIVTVPSNYAVSTGLIGLFSYALFAGVPIILIGFLGSGVVDLFPKSISLADFARQRFGTVVYVLVIVIALLSMVTALIAEYTTVGSLFQYYVLTENYPVIIYMGMVTMLYTAYGGLTVSILTDRLQAIASVVLVVIVVIYGAASFDWNLVSGKSLDNELIGITYSGWSSIVAMPISLSCATVFSEAIWQRVWASESKNSLIFGSCIACIGVSAMTLTFGLGGWLMNLAGLVTPNTNPNLYWFLLFSSPDRDRQQQQQMPPSENVLVLNNWAGLLTMTATCIMSCSAVDSFQNGLTATISSALFRGKSLMYTRVTVFIINVPLMAIACLNVADSVLNLLMFINLVCTCAAIPICAGVIKNRRIARFIGQFSVCSSILLAMLSLSAYGIIREHGHVWDGLKLAWYSNGYGWEYFIIPVVASALGLIIFGGAEILFSTYVLNK